MIENPKTAYDRLSALMVRFKLDVRVATPTEANLFVWSPCDDDPAGCIVLCSAQAGCDGNLPLEHLRFSAYVDWGGDHNPLMSALPERIVRPISDDLQSIVALLIAEKENARCGAASVLSRLGEVLVVCLLREQLATGNAHRGLLGGLADERISRAIVAIHEQPGHHWRNAELAQLAGLSASRFAEVFLSAVGETPAAYLRKWRLILAKQDIERGDRVQTVAWRYCYKSSEALGRAFRKMFGETPTGRRTSASG